MIFLLDDSSGMYCRAIILGFFLHHQSGNSLHVSLVLDLLYPGSHVFSFICSFIFLKELSGTQEIKILSF